MKLYLIYCMTTYSVICHFYHPFVLYFIKRATKSVYRLKDGGFRPLVWKIKIKSGEAEFDKTDKFSMILPENKDFQKLDLGKDLSADIKKAENDTVSK